MRDVCACMRNMTWKTNGFISIRYCLQERTANKNLQFLNRSLAYGKRQQTAQCLGYGLLSNTILQGSRTTGLTGRRRKLWAWGNSEEPRGQALVWPGGRWVGWENCSRRYQQCAKTRGQQWAGQGVGGGILGRERAWAQTRCETDGVLGSRDQSGLEATPGGFFHVCMEFKFNLKAVEADGLYLWGAKCQDCVWQVAKHMVGAVCWTHQQGTDGRGIKAKPTLFSKGWKRETNSGEKTVLTISYPWHRLRINEQSFYTCLFK